MLKLLALIPLLTYGEWFFRTYEREAIYPFDANWANPANADLPGLTEERVAMVDGTEVILWRRAADPGRPTLLYLPGNAGNLLGRAGRFRLLADAGYGFVALSWRGQGGSGGKPDEVALSSDALFVYDLVADLHPVIYGESLGTAAAVKIAAQREAAALVLESPFTSIPALARIQYPGQDVAGLVTQIWDTVSRVGAVDEPLLVLHGTDDRLVPIAQGEAIFAAAGSTDKAMLRLEGADHTGIWFEPAGRDALFSFLDRF
jgi:alpha-beta hydrolase superfamily lysophospholipase